MYQAMGEIYHNCNYEVAGIALSMPGAVNSEVGNIEGASCFRLYPWAEYQRGSTKTLQHKSFN